MIMNGPIFRPVWVCLAGMILAGCTPPAVGFAADTPTAETTVPSGDFDRRLASGSMDRSYLLHVPPNVRLGQSVPLVLVFHGMWEDGAYISLASGFNEVSDAHGFIVVYPNGTAAPGPLSWNAGGCCGYALLNRIDEPAFIREILADLDRLVTIDPKRIYAAGFSNGAMLVYSLACEMSGTFAAIAPVAGILPSSLCQPRQPVSVIHIHGLNDVSVPYGGGGTNPSTGSPFPSVTRGINAWVRLDGCPDSPQVEQDGMVMHTSYASCQNGTSVELYVVRGLGHLWPPPYILPASRIIWNFFAAHPKP